MRPNKDRAAWLLSDVSLIGRQNIGAEQYEELRQEAVHLKQCLNATDIHLKKAYEALYKWRDSCECAGLSGTIRELREALNSIEVIAAQEMK